MKQNFKKNIYKSIKKYLKYPGIDLMKDRHDLHEKISIVNGDMPCSSIGSLCIVKLSTLCKLFYNLLQPQNPQVDMYVYV